MAITTLNDLTTAFQRRAAPRYFSKNAGFPSGAVGWTSAWAQDLVPPKATYPGASLTWVIPTSATTGVVFPFDNPSSGSSYLGRVQLRNTSNQSASMIIYDRLAHTGAITPAASTQNLTTTPLTRPDALGGGVELWYEHITGTTATPSTWTCSYTNGAGTAGQTTQPLVGLVSSGSLSPMQPFCLADGDSGIRSVESFTGTGAIGGTGMLVLLRRLVSLPAHIAQDINMVYDAISLGMPQIYDDACLTVMMANLGGGGGYAVGGSAAIIQG